MRKKRLPMGALENAVMDVLWTDSSWMTPGEVHAHLAAQRDLAYTTVTTVMVRLFEKGRLERRKGRPGLRLPRRVDPNRMGSRPHGRSARGDGRPQIDADPLPRSARRRRPHTAPADVIPKDRP